jgi:hypothetical protein
MSGRVRIRRPDGGIQVGYRKTDRRNPRRVLVAGAVNRYEPRRQVTKTLVQLEIFPEYTAIEERRRRKRRQAERWRLRV